MSADKTTAKIGNLLDGSEERDAIHVAVLPAVAGHRLEPGAHVGLKCDLAWAHTGADIGIVDPYLRKRLNEGDRFYIFLYPGSITSLRHEWTHPALPAAPAHADAVASAVAAARAEIESIAKEMGHDGSDDNDEWGGYGPRRDMTYERLMAAAETWIENEEPEVERGGQSWQKDFPAASFWRLWSIVTGRPAPEGAPSFFSCSC